MKSISFILVLCILCIYTNAQSPCSQIKYIDQLAVSPPEPPIQDFRKANYNDIPDSVKNRIKAEIIKETSSSFFKGLKVKEVKVFDSAVNEKLFTPATILDGNENPVDFLYVIFYEELFKDIPFVFKLEVKQNGELLKKGQFEGIVNQKKKIIPCSKALSIAASDKEAPITKPGDLYIYYNDNYKTIVWQVMEADNTNGDSQHVTVIDAFTGDVLDKNEFLKGSTNFESTP
ncbi:MAG TPA: hypothetical protein VIM79_24815 [Niastella sp.]